MLGQIRPESAPHVPMEGMNSNRSGRDRLTVLRLHSPLEPFFDKTWQSVKSKR